MSTRTAARRDAWVVAATVVTICSVLSFSGQPVRDALSYSRADLHAWSLATAHLVHLDVSHAILDVVAFALVACTFARDLATPAAQLAVLATGAIAIDAALWFLHPEVARYAGLSGLVHAWFAAGVVLWIAHAYAKPADARRIAWGVALAIGLVAKLAIEADGRSFWDAGFGWPVVTAAHRWGAAGGALAAVALAVFRRRA